MDAATFYPVVRGLLFIFLLLLIGTQTARWIASRQFAAPGPVLDSLDALLPTIASALVLLSAARAGLQLWGIKEPGEPLTADLTWAVLLEGRWATAWLLQSAAFLMLLIISGQFVKSPGQRAKAIGALTVLALWGQTGMGHAASSFWHGPLGRVLQLAHLSGAGIWLGTLGILAIVMLPPLREESQLPLLAGVLQDFSLLARAGAAMVALSGLLIALKYAGSLTAFVASTWGQLLLLKVAALGGVAALGWYNWRVVTPTVGRGEAKGVMQLRRAVRLELALGLVMLAITAFLVATQLPRETLQP